MECSETVTSSGRGMWGYHDAAWALSTIRETWHERHGSASQSLERFGLSTRLLTPQRSLSEFRRYDTEGERQSFFDASITQRMAADLEPGLLHGCETWQAAWLGQRLMDVTLVADYFQLGLGRHGGNFYVWPEIRKGSNRLQENLAGYRDALRSFVGERLTEADVYLDDGLVLQFESGELAFSPERLRSALHEAFEIDGMWIYESKDPPWGLPHPRDIQ